MLKQRGEASRRVRGGGRSEHESDRRSFGRGFEEDRDGFDGRHPRDEFRLGEVEQTFSGEQERRRFLDRRRELDALTERRLGNESTERLFDVSDQTFEKTSEIRSETRRPRRSRYVEQSTDTGDTERRTKTPHRRRKRERGEGERGEGRDRRGRLRPQMRVARRSREGSCGFGMAGGTGLHPVTETEEAPRQTVDQRVFASESFRRSRTFEQNHVGCFENDVRRHALTEIRESRDQSGIRFRIVFRHDESGADGACGRDARSGTHARDPCRTRDRDHGFPGAVTRAECERKIRERRRLRRDPFDRQPRKTHRDPTFHDSTPKRVAVYGEFPDI